MVAMHCNITTCNYMCVILYTNMYIIIPYNRLFSLGTNFLNGLKIYAGLFLSFAIVMDEQITLLVLATCYWSLPDPAVLHSLAFPIFSLWGQPHNKGWQCKGWIDRLRYFSCWDRE